MADPVVEPRPLIEEAEYAQFQGILKELPDTYAEWLEIRKNMRAKLERPHKYDLSQIEIRDISISPEEYAKFCADRGGCSSIEDLGRFAREEYAKMIEVRTTESG